MRLSILLILLLVPQAFAAAVHSIDDFEAGLSPNWQAKSFGGDTEYRVVAGGSGKVLQATSRGTASGLIYKIDYSLNDYPLLHWRWKIANVLEKGDARRKEGDDYPARVYVIFPHWFPPKTRSINYIWDNRLPKESFLPNAFYANAIMVVAESGREKVGQWIEEVRDVRADYRRIFGGEPPPVGAIALMTDTDNTGETATAWYDDIRIEAGGMQDR